jgi:nucleoporin POM34
MSLARTSQSVAPRTPATPSTPSTPAAQSDQPYTPSGSWKHPKFDEIARRQHATTFDERNVRAIVANASLLALSFYGSSLTQNVKLLGYAAYAPSSTPTLTPTNIHPSTPITSLVHAVPYSTYMIALIRLVFLINIGIAFLPLVRAYYPDDIADIPLTPSQRASMGLRADIASPATPGSYASPNYVTPPRYQRSTPRSASFSAQESPLGSPRGSPLFQKAMSGSATKRLSYSGSSMGSSLFGESTASVGGTPGTPTPSTGKASVGLNNKWLYEKRRDSPRSGIFA